MDFAKSRPWFFLLSALIILPGVVFLILSPGLKPGIDFTGGSSLTVQFPELAKVNQESIRTELSKIGYEDAKIQNFGVIEANGEKYETFFLRTQTLNEEQKDSLVQSLNNKFSPEETDTLQSFDLVSAVVAEETVINALWAVLAAAVGIFFYIWWAFRNVPSPFRYGLAAIIALLHDTLIVVGIFS